MILDESAYLEHYGVKGMKWGQRKAARQENRAKNRDARATEKATQAFAERQAKLRAKQVDAEYGRFRSAKTSDRIARDRKIDRARGDVASGKTDREYKRARAQYKKDKTELGSYTARKLLREAKTKRAVDHFNAAALKDGRETTVRILEDMADAAIANAKANAAARERATPAVSPPRRQSPPRPDGDGRY